MSAPIIVKQHPEEHTRTPENSCYWIAEAVIDGKVYTARSRRSAPNELARLLAAAGIPDQPVLVYSAGIAGYATFPSIRKAADVTIRESASAGLRSARWVPAPLEWPGKLTRNAENSYEAVPDGLG